MTIKRFLSIFICFMIIFPSFVKAASANEVTSLCLNSGISGYYESVSKAAFDMVNIIFKDFLDISAQPSKKEVPDKHDRERSQDTKAVILDNAAQKTFKTNLLPGVPLTFDISKDVNVSSVSATASSVSFGWMILLITLLILSIKKKDDYAVSLNNYANTRPV